MKWKSSLIVECLRKPTCAAAAAPKLVFQWMRLGSCPQGVPTLMKYTDLYKMIKIQCHKLHKPQSGMEKYILVILVANRLH